MNFYKTIIEALHRRLHKDDVFQMPPEPPVRYCCMCGAPETDVNLIIKGADNHFICDRCATAIHYQMDQTYKYVEQLKAEKEAKENPESEYLYVPIPEEIKKHLDEYVIGQDDAKIKLAVAVYNHYKRVCQEENDVDIVKSNMIICGPTGSGKTEMVKTVAKMLDVPTAIVDANSLTQAGYVGEDVESILTRLLQNADGDLEKAQRGIVIIDEIDKIARDGANPSITKDVSGEGVQQALLKMLEGAVINVPYEIGRKHPEKETVQMDTSNILFICCGAFVGIEQIVKKRMNKMSVGFKSIEEGKKLQNSDNPLKYIIPEDFRQFGLIPEFIGRLPIITYVNELDKTALRRILTEPKNAIIKQYQKLLLMDNVKLTFTDDTIDYIVDEAMKSKLGARALRAIVENIMTKYMYTIPSTNKKSLTITREMVDPDYVPLKQMA